MWMDVRPSSHNACALLSTAPPSTNRPNRETGMQTGRPELARSLATSVYAPTPQPPPNRWIDNSGPFPFHAHATHARLPLGRSPKLSSGWVPCRSPPHRTSWLLRKAPPPTRPWRRRRPAGACGRPPAVRGGDNRGVGGFIRCDGSCCCKRAVVTRRAAPEQSTYKHAIATDRHPKQERRNVRTLVSSPMCALRASSQATSST